MIDSRSFDYGKILFDGNTIGGYVQIKNLLVEVKQSDDEQGYIIDIWNNDNEELISTVTVWNDQLESEEM